EDIALLHLEHAAHQRFRRAEQLDAHEIDVIEPVLPAFFDVDGEVRAFAGAIRIDQGKPEPAPADVDNLGFLAAGANCIVSLLLIELRDTLLIFFVLRRIESLGEKAFKEDRTGNADGPQVAHRSANYAIAENCVPFDVDLPDLDFGTLVHFERDLER